MYRRDFLKMLAAGIVAGWASKCWPEAWPVSGEPAANPDLTIACLGDAHLRDGSDRRAEARSLARAVAEIRALNPAPNLVLFAGDLAHDGDPDALALGAEILAELPMPLLAVRGEGDGDPRGAASRRIFREGRFFYTCQGVNLLGLDTVWQDGADGPGFVLREPQPRWLAETLPRLDPAAPLIVLSHAPLAPIYRPWGQWTRDCGPVLDRLARFQNVMFVHGHVHHGDLFAEKKSEYPGVRQTTFPRTENRQPKTFSPGPAGHVLAPAVTPDRHTPGAASGARPPGLRLGPLANRRPSSSVPPDALAGLSGGSPAHTNRIMAFSCLKRASRR